MININYIMNGGRKGSRKGSRKTNSLFDLFLGKGNPVVGDRVTPAQRKVFKSARKQRKPMLLFGDWDRDGVINGLDCAPRNRNKHMAKYYHGTTNLYSDSIKDEGLKTSKDLKKMRGFTQYTSDKTDTEHTYFFKEPMHAKIYGESLAYSQGMGKPVVLEVDVDEKKVERDYNIPFGEAYKYKGSIPKEKIKEFQEDAE